jgi:hypothetical protein
MLPHLLVQQLPPQKPPQHAAWPAIEQGQATWWCGCRASGNGSARAALSPTAVRSHHAAPPAAWCSSAAVGGGCLEQGHKQHSITSRSITSRSITSHCGHGAGEAAACLAKSLPVLPCGGNQAQPAACVLPARKAAAAYGRLQHMDACAMPGLPWRPGSDTVCMRCMRSMQSLARSLLHTQRSWAKQQHTGLRPNVLGLLAVTCGETQVRSRQPGRHGSPGTATLPS